MRKKLVGDARKRQGRGFALIGSALFLFPADLAIIGSIRIFICISKKGKRVASDRAARCDGCSQRPSGCRSLLDQKIKGKTLTNHKVCRSFLLLFCLVKTKGAIEPAHVLLPNRAKRKIHRQQPFCSLLLLFCRRGPTRRWPLSLFGFLSPRIDSIWKKRGQRESGLCGRVFLFYVEHKGLFMSRKKSGDEKNMQAQGRHTIERPFFYLWQRARNFTIGRIVQMASFSQKKREGAECARGQGRTPSDMPEKNRAMAPCKSHPKNNALLIISPLSFLCQAESGKKKRKM